MRKSVVSLRKVTQPASEDEAKISASVSRKTPAARTIPLDLGPLIFPYRGRRRLTLRIEGLPQLARLSAGQNNGDNSWSLALDDLEGLSYFPPKGFDRQHTLKLRVIAKDETGASGIALIDFPVMCDDARANAAPSQPSGVAAGKEPIPQGGVLQEDILSLRVAFAER